MLRILLLSCAILAGMTATQAHSQAANSSLINPMSIQDERGATSDLLDRVLKETDDEKRYQGVVGFIDFYGEWVTINGGGLVARVHVGSYLLQSGKGELAAALLKNGVIKGWLTYQFMQGVASDFNFALEGKSLPYLHALFNYAPSGLNTPLTLNLQGSQALPLAVLASRPPEDDDRAFYQEVLLAMLEAGANPHQKMNTGLSSMLIASANNNVLFVRITQSFLDGQTKSLQGLLKNTPLEASEMLEAQAIADTFIEESSEQRQRFTLKKLHQLWTNMIMRGYNIAADVILEEMKTRQSEGFNIDMRPDGNLSGLMAATMSPLYGGNVEYAQRLINAGADPQVLTKIKGNAEHPDVEVNYIQLAFQRDNYKIVALMVANNVNFVTAPDDPGVYLLAEALEQKAFMSAHILKAALDRLQQQLQVEGE